MIKAFLHLVLFALMGVAAKAQPTSYADLIQDYQANYVAHHEVVKGEDRQFFRFFPANATYKTFAKFIDLKDPTGFMMATSGKSQQQFFRYGLLKFKIAGGSYQLTVYRSKALLNDPDYKDYLFVPFTDKTSGEESYGGGRYIDLRTTQITKYGVWLDFNKAYNPYCAYSKGFNCPIPPIENDLPMAIHAGEMDFAKQSH